MDKVARIGQITINRTTKFWLLGLLLVAIFLCHAPAADAQQKTQSSSVVKRLEARTLKDLSQQINVDKQRITIATTKLNQLKEYHQQILNKSSEKNVFALLEAKQLTLAEAKADKLNQEQLLLDAKQKLSEVQIGINHYQESLRDAQATAVRTKQPKPGIEQLSWRLDYLNTYFELQTKHIDALERSHQIAADIVDLEQDIVMHLTKLAHLQSDREREQKLIQLADTVQQKRTALLAELRSYNSQLDRYQGDQRYSSPEAIHLGILIFKAEEHIFLGDETLRLEHLNDDVSDFLALTHQDLTVHEIDRYLNDIKQLELQLHHTRDRIDNKLSLLESKLDIQNQLRSQKIISQSDYAKNELVLKQLKTQYQSLRQQAVDSHELLMKYENQLRTTLNKNIALRQGFPGWNLEEWNNLLHKVSHIPISSVALVKTLRDHVVLSIKTIESARLGVLLLALTLWVLVFFFGRRLLDQVITYLKLRHEKMTFSIALGLMLTIKRNFTLLIGFALLFTTLYVLQIPFKAYRFAFILYLSIIGVMTSIVLARITLLERISDASGLDVKVYHRLKWALIVGGFVWLFNSLASELNIAYDVRDFFNRIFMLFLFIFSCVLYRLRHFITQLIIPYIEERRLYLRRAIELLAWLVPLTLLSNAVVGLLGYLQLAGIMSYYQLMILLVATSYVIVRGVMIDFMELLSELTIQNFSNGWLLSQALLIPLDKAVRFILFLLSWVALFYSFGWGMESFVVQRLASILTTPLVSLTGAEITLLSFIQFIILAVIVFWAARWSRELSYRILFADVRDQSMRNSLAAFTRYSTITIGTIITLQVLGINISGLSYIIGGLAVGIGFGLRDFANNIVSGIMLLIERPVREGDIVSVNEYEGVVSRIGLRSMTVKSYDYVEVMVPNADVLNKTFTNWTHQDSIARTVLPIKVHRHDDPIRVQEIILQVLHELPAVLDDPEPKVYLRGLDESLIFMEARYFINLENNLRVSVQSLVLFSIWERFKAHGIRAPFPQQDIRLLESDPKKE